MSQPGLYDHNVCDMFEQDAVRIKDAAANADNQPGQVWPQTTQCGEDVGRDPPRVAVSATTINQVQTEPVHGERTCVVFSAAHIGSLGGPGWVRWRHRHASGRRSRTS